MTKLKLAKKLHEEADTFFLSILKEREPLTWARVKPFAKKGYLHLAAWILENYTGKESK